MSHKHKRLLRTIYAEPVSANVHWRDVESLLHHQGAEVVYTHGARVRVILNRTEGQLHRPHHGGSCGKFDIRHLREFLARAGVTLAAYEEQQGSSG
jgi:hypothetical protein